MEKMSAFYGCVLRIPNTSGATYPGVPQRSKRYYSFSKYSDMPKSIRTGTIPDSLL